MTIDWIEADLVSSSPPAGAFDLVAIVYLHLPPEQRHAVYRAAAAAVAPGGRLLSVGHDRTNLTEGAGGPQDPERLFTAAELAEGCWPPTPGSRSRRPVRSGASHTRTADRSTRSCEPDGATRCGPAEHANRSAQRMPVSYSTARSVGWSVADTVKVIGGATPSWPVAGSGVRV